jgi:hypothetical protein
MFVVLFRVTLKKTASAEREIPALPMPSFTTVGLWMGIMERIVQTSCVGLLGLCAPICSVPVYRAVIKEEDGNKAQNTVPHIPNHKHCLTVPRATAVPNVSCFVGKFNCHKKIQRKLIV